MGMNGWRVMYIGGVGGEVVEVNSEMEGKGGCGVVGVARSMLCWYRLVPLCKRYLCASRIEDLNGASVIP